MKGMRHDGVEEDKWQVDEEDDLKVREHLRENDRFFGRNVYFY